MPLVLHLVVAELPDHALRKHGRSLEISLIAFFRSSSANDLSSKNRWLCQVGHPRCPSTTRQVTGKSPLCLQIPDSLNECAVVQCRHDARLGWRIERVSRTVDRLLKEVGGASIEVRRQCRVPVQRGEDVYAPWITLWTLRARRHLSDRIGV